MKSFTTAMQDIEAEDAGLKDADRYIEFELDGRTLRAYHPTDGQLAFLLAAIGRGQTSDQRFAGILNILFSSLRDEDADYIESRMLSRDPKLRLPVADIEQIFEYLVEEWFATPTQSASDSAQSQPSDGPRSNPTTTEATSSESGPANTSA